MKHTLKYRGYEISEGNYKGEWEYCHEDYDGAPDHSESGPCDSRFGIERSIEGCIETINEIEDQ